MKHLIVLFFALFSLTAFAHVDFLVGNYKNSTSEARVIKELVKPADLFEPAVYSYFLELQTDKYSIGIEKELAVSADGESLSVSTDYECDDPGCTYYTDIRINVFKKAGKPVLEAYFFGYQYDEDGREDKEIEGTLKLNKVK